jgi:hypothetical protein
MHSTAVCRSAHGVSSVGSSCNLASRLIMRVPTEYMLCNLTCNCQFHLYVNQWWETLVLVSSGGIWSLLVPKKTPLPVAGNRCATYPPGCDGSQLRARHGQAPQVRKYNWRWRAAFTILCLFPSFASSCQPSQKASATPTMFYDSLSLFCLSTFPESFSYSNNILRFSLSLLLVNLPRKLQLLQHSFLYVDYPFLRQQQQQQLPVCNLRRF